MCQGKNEVCTGGAGEVRCAHRDGTGDWDGAGLRRRSGEDGDWNGAGLERRGEGQDAVYQQFKLARTDQ
jgi:hypothetical protein